MPLAVRGCQASASMIYGIIFAILFSSISAAQVTQSGNVTAGHNACWAASGVLQDCGVPANSTLMLTSPLLTLTDSATVTPDFSQAVNFTWTLGATGRTLANPVNFTSSYIGVVFRIYLVEDATGSRTITTWGSAYKFSGGVKPTLSTGAGAVDRISCFARSTTALDCDFVANYQ